LTSSTIVGVIVLAQLPTRLEIAGLALVVLGVAVHGERREERAAPH
jgi:inner membrane transporter RhtA